MSDKRLFYIIMGVITISGIVTFVHDQYVLRKTWLETYKKSSFSGVIKDTVHIVGEGGMPTYNFTNDSSHYSDVGEAYIQRIAKIGDSLNKRSGEDTISIFRKNSSGSYIQIYPVKRTH